MMIAKRRALLAGALAVLMSCSPADKSPAASGEKAAVPVPEHQSPVRRHRSDAAPRIELNKILKNGDSCLDSLDMDVLAFMKRWEIKGMSLSVTRNDSLLYSKGYGIADDSTSCEMTPGTILRVASVSKLITAAGIMKLCDMGELSLRDNVFGPDGRLAFLNSSIRDKRYFKITVEDLLRHEGGFSTKSMDPVFSILQVTRKYGLDHAPTRDELVRLIIHERLDFYPGTAREYSNFGYLLLSMVIESVTGESYESWMCRNVLNPAGCYDMHIGGNYYEDKFPNEARYYPQAGDPPVSEYNNSGRQVPRCYGGNDIPLLQGAGAWVTSTAELARFVSAIDGLPGVPDVISPENVREMTAWFDPQTYSLGWNFTDRGGWSRTGTLGATSALIRYFPDGECWVLVTNTGTWLGARFSRRTSRLVGDCRKRYSAQLPARNMFER